MQRKCVFRLASTFELSDEQPKTIRPRARSVPRHGEPADDLSDDDNEDDILKNGKKSVIFQKG